MNVLYSLMRTHLGQNEMLGIIGETPLERRWQWVALGGKVTARLNGHGIERLGVWVGR